MDESENESQQIENVEEEEEESQIIDQEEEDDEPEDKNQKIEPMKIEVVSKKQNEANNKGLQGKKEGNHNGKQINFPKKLQQQQEESQEEEKDEQINLTSLEMKKFINSICSNIFLNFSKFYFEEKDFMLSSQSIIKLFRNVNIIGTNNLAGVKLNQFDIILKKISPKKVSKLNSTQFLNLVVILASKANPKKFNKSPKEEVYRFVKKRLEPISLYIIDTENNGNQFLYKAIEKTVLELPNEQIDTQAKPIINSLIKSIRTIYSVYFDTEMTKPNNQYDQLMKESLTNLIEFCKNYELIPALISLDKVAIIYNSLADKDEIQFTAPPLKGNGNGVVFTINKFCLFLINCANVIFNEESESLAEKMVIFFKRLETSSGCILTEKKHHMPSNECYSLGLDETIVEEILQNKEGGNSITEEGYIKRKYDETKSKELSYKPPRTSGLLTKKEQQTIDLDNQTPGDKKDNEILEDFFETYATIGDKMNFSQMTITSFHKLLKDFGIYDMKKSATGNNSNTFRMTSTMTYSDDHLTETETSLIFFEVCGLKTCVKENKEQLISSSLNKKDGRISLRMSFELFLTALQMIASRLHPELSTQEAFGLFKSQDLSLDQLSQKPERGINQFIDNLSRISNSDLKNILLDFQNPIYQCYLNYSDANERINFQRFFHFFKDFSIFPDICNLVEIKKMFFALLQIQTEQTKSQKTLDQYVLNEERENPIAGGKFDALMNFDLFLYSIALTSNFIKIKENGNDYEKLLFLFSKMAMSNGSTNPRKLTGTGRLMSVNKDLIETIEIVKEKYPNYFPQKDQMKEIMQSENVFNDLFTE